VGDAVVDVVGGVGRKVGPGGTGRVAGRGWRGRECGRKLLENGRLKICCAEWLVVLGRCACG